MFRTSIAAIGLAALPLVAAAEQSDPVTIGKITYTIPKSYLCYSCNPWIPTLKVPGLPDLILQGTDLSEAKIQAIKELGNPHAGPFGYQIYTTGQEYCTSHPDGCSYNEEYVGADLYFSCTVHTSGAPTTCVDTVSLGDGNQAFFIFPTDQIKDIPEIEARIRKLVTSFPAKDHQCQVHGEGKIICMNP
jgi:hypothetical protein